MKPRIVYVHGDGVLCWRWGWVERLQAELSLRGYPTHFELMPDSIEARARYWLPFLRDHARVGEHDVLLGWSCGAVAALRYAQTQALAGLVLVAPYYTDLGSEQVRRSGFVSEPWNFERIRTHAPRRAMFHGDADPYVSQEEFRALAAELRVEPQAMPGAGHFGQQADFPELLAHLTCTYP
jgi:predicted alpha/beta hydrolase family esterase